MANAFQLRIVTPTRQLLDEQVREVTGPGTLGEFGVLPDHVTFLTSLESGTLTFLTDAGAKKVAVRGGFAEVAENVMTVLADDAVFTQDIDIAKTRAELQAAEARLEILSAGDAEYESVDSSRRWAQAKVEAAR